jgi:hypothetical protein
MWVAGSAQALTQPTHLPTHHWFSFKFFFSFFPEKERERRGDEVRVGCFAGSAEGGVFSKPSILLLPGTGGGSYIFFLLPAGTGGGSYIFFLLLPGIGGGSYIFFLLQEEEVTFFSFCCPVQNFPGIAHTNGQTLLPLYIRCQI